MRLQRGEVQDYDFDRMVVTFTMLNQGKVVRCAISCGCLPLQNPLTTAGISIRSASRSRANDHLDAFDRHRLCLRLQIADIERLGCNVR